MISQCMHNISGSYSNMRLLIGRRMSTKTPECRHKGQFPRKEGSIVPGHNRSGRNRAVTNGEDRCRKFV